MFPKKLLAIFLLIIGAGCASPNEQTHISDNQAFLGGDAMVAPSQIEVPYELSGYGVYLISLEINGSEVNATYEGKSRDDTDRSGEPTDGWSCQSFSKKELWDTYHFKVPSSALGINCQMGKCSQVRYPVKIEIKMLDTRSFDMDEFRIYDSNGQLRATVKVPDK